MKIRKIPRIDAVVLVSVSVITVLFDLAIAVFAGVVISALAFAWENSKRIRARKHHLKDGTKVYEIWGPLFFGSVSVFNAKFDVKNDPDKVQIDFLESRVCDHSAMESLFNLIDKYKKANKQLLLKHLSSDCKMLLIKANPMFQENIEDSINDPKYHLAENSDSFR